MNAYGIPFKNTARVKEKGRNVNKYMTGKKSAEVMGWISSNVRLTKPRAIR
jgi:hypothetical protein